MKHRKKKKSNTFPTFHKRLPLWAAFLFPGIIPCQPIKIENCDLPHITIPPLLCSFVSKPSIMWNNTRATKILGAQYPILQGPFGGNVSTVQLAAAVSNAGGIGGYGAYTLTPQEIYTIDAELKKATNKPYNINLWISDTDAPSSNPNTPLPGAPIPGSSPAADLQKVTALFQPYFDSLGIAPPSTPPSFTSRFENQIEVILHTRPPPSLALSSASHPPISWQNANN